VTTLDGSGRSAIDHTAVRLLELIDWHWRSYWGRRWIFGLGAQTTCREWCVQIADGKFMARLVDFRLPGMPSGSRALDFCCLAMGLANILRGAQMERTSVRRDIENADLLAKGKQHLAR